MRRLTTPLMLGALGAAITAAMPASLPAAAEGGGADNVVIANGTAGNTTAEQSGLSVAFDPADTVANQNVAAARATDCEGCRTVAVAMQVVIVEGYPHDFRPANAAAATNSNCQACTTYAYAYQYVIQPARTVTLSSNARQTIADLRAQVATTTAANLDYDTLRTQLDSLFNQLVSTIDNDLTPTGPPVTATSSIHAERT